MAVIVYLFFAKRVILPNDSHNPCSFRMNKKHFSELHVEDNDGMQQAFKAELMTCLLIDRRVNV
ncbi:hypothetical protein ASB62_02155 [Chlorobium limicola]|uniref:Uncharacterized protein n=1 Tax=Chlorobium limicola TaxID=1092 RepID=A0A101JSQ7_CHLLI|nr:hypothetical protein ASB62_02155 [Chlorobium limicola]